MFGSQLFLSPGFGDAGYGQFELVKFPGGEEHIKLNPIVHWGEDDGHVQIVQRLRSSADVMLLLLANDALRRFDNVKTVSAYLPYFPYAQQDRVMVPGEALSVKVMADLVNGCGFHKVTIYDPHSDVTPALVHRSRVLTNHTFVKWAYRHLGELHHFRPLLVSPDAGAKKKLLPLCREIGYEGDVAVGDKVRDLKTGEIIGQKLYYDGDLDGVGCLIVDDICVGGRTFIELAKKLRERGAASVHLAVSHGVLKGGYDATAYPGIDGIYCTDSWQTLPEVASEVGFIQQYYLNVKGEF